MFDQENQATDEPTESFDMQSFLNFIWSEFFEQKRSPPPDSEKGDRHHPQPRDLRNDNVLSIKY